MRLARSIHRKAAKKRAARKDYERRRNINRNVPTDVSLEKKETFRPVMWEGHPVIKDGVAAVEHTGYKTVTVKTPRFRFKDSAQPHRPRQDAAGRDVGMIEYPMPRKFRKSKKEKISV